MTARGLSGKKAELRKRFMRFVKKHTNGCWLWTGGINGRGYGNFCVRRNTKSAHRVAWELERGKIPAGQFVCHTCDEPTCVNPDHLFLGDARANTLDAKSKGRLARQKGEAHGGSKLTNGEVLEIRARYASGEGVTALSRAFGVNHATVSHIVHRKHWTHI